MRLPVIGFFKPRNARIENKSSGFQAFYDEHWRQRDAYFEHHRLRFLTSWDYIADLDWSSATVLDLAGIGPIADYAKHCFDATVLETSHDLRKTAPFEDNTADIIICTETIEHIKDIDSDRIEDLEAFNFSGVLAMLREFARVGRPGAKVFITTTNSSSIISLMKWVQRKPLMMDENHVREFTVSELIEKCAMAGLKKMRVGTVSSWATNDYPLAAKLSNTLRDAGHDMSDREDNIMGIFVVR